MKIYHIHSNFKRVTYKFRVLLCVFAITTLIYITLYNLSVSIIETCSDIMHKNQSLVKKRFPCEDIKTRSFNTQRGFYWILHNYIRAARTFKCDESITYTTHADFTFLDNLVPLLERWQGPVSVSIYAPGTDYNETLTRILYLRECTFSSLVKEYVSFHFILQNVWDIPDNLIHRNPLSIKINCNTFPSFGDKLKTYRKIKNLTYPINVARNVAKEMSTTHFVLPSDIELYPSPNLIQNFLNMILRNVTLISEKSKPNVFVLSIFELDGKVKVLPRNKVELLEMVKNGSAIVFHKNVCPECHEIPLQNKWYKSALFPDGEAIFHVAKRYSPHESWEPIYIGTKYDPGYDERLSWEGRKDKMPQAFTLCLLDYEFHILDTGFLVHRPGIKRAPNKNVTATKSEILQNTLISFSIKPALIRIYGNRPGCSLYNNLKYKFTSL